MKLHELYPKGFDMMDDEINGDNADKVSSNPSEGNLKLSSVMFPEISLNPASAKDIKQWILQLAVEGKLTKKWREENPDTESAAKLIKKMSLELKELIKNKKVKNEKDLDPINEVVLNVPHSWAPVRLGNIGDWGAGATPLRSVSTYYDGEINWYKSGELNNGIIDYPSEEKITEEALKKCSLRMNKPGDVLIAMYGATIGKTGLLQTFGTTNQAICGCTPYSGITSSFLILLLNGYKTVFIDQGEGGAQPNISRIKIRNQIILLPPLEEQQAIVTIVEDLFKEVDALAQQATERIGLKRSYAQAALQRLCEADTAKEWQQIVSVFPEIFNEKQTIKTLRETILQLAVQGKLTAKWRSSSASLPTYQTAHELLAQIKAEKTQLIKDKKIKAEKPLPAIEADEIPFELPEGWVWCRLGEVSKQITDGEHQTPPRLSEGKLLLSAKNIRDGYIDYENCDYISEENFQKSIKRCHPEVGDLLIVSVGGTIGRISMVNNDTPFALVRSVAMIKNTKLVPDYLRWVMNSPLMQETVENRKRGGAQPCLYLSEIKEFKFPLAPIQEQKIIVEKVNAMMGLCDELEKGVEGLSKTEDLLKMVLSTGLEVNNKNVEV